MSSKSTPVADSGADRLNDEPRTTPGANGLGHDCLVCGKPSTTRCSSCFAKSGFSLYFCSTEHQKIAWPFHKLVCGERAHPFRLPPFTQEEADLAYERIMEPGRLPKKSRVIRASLRKSFEPLLSDPARLRARLGGLVGCESGMTFPSSVPGAAADELPRDELVALLRFCESQWASALDTSQAAMFGEFLVRYLDLDRDGQASIKSASHMHSVLCHSIVAEVAINSELVRAYRALGAGPPWCARATQLAQLAVDNLRHRLQVLQSPALTPSAAAFCSSAIEKTRIGLEETKRIFACYNVQ